MLPVQVLTNNLLYDFSQVPIPTDDVDPEQIAKPRPWLIDEITRFILFIGPISSIFDYTTFFVMLYVISIDDFAKVEMRTGEIKTAETHPRSEEASEAHGGYWHRGPPSLRGHCRVLRA